MHGRSDRNRGALLIVLIQGPNEFKAEEYRWLVEESVPGKGLKTWIEIVSTTAVLNTILTIAQREMILRADSISHSD